MSVKNIQKSSDINNSLSALPLSRIQSISKWERPSAWLPLPDTSEGMNGIFVIQPQRDPVAFVNSAVYLQSHEFVVGDRIKFESLTGSTGLAENTLYYINAVTRDTFTVSETLGGTAVPINGNGTALMVHSKSCYCAVRLITSTGTYTVDWGDGTIETANSNVQLDHRFDFHHPQVQQNGLTAEGFGQVLIRITVAVPGALRNITTFAFRNSIQGWVDIVVAGSGITSLSLSNSSMRIVERCRILSWGTLTTAASMFSGFLSLQSLSIPNYGTGSVANFSNMFNGCTKLTEVPYVDTRNATDMGGMFASCYDLQTVPLLKTSKVTNFGSMFADCRSLEYVPHFDTSSATSFYRFFFGCNSLKEVPKFNSINVTRFDEMFYDCFSLESVPQFNTTKGILFNGFFRGCRSLKSIPSFDTANGTNFSYFVFQCTSLTEVPWMNTSKGTNFEGIYYGATSLRKVPALDTANGTNFNYFYYAMSNITEIPWMDTSKGTAFSQMFYANSSVRTIPAFNFTGATSDWNTFNFTANLTSALCYGMRYTFTLGNGKLSKTALQTLFSNMGTAVNTSQSVTISGNTGADTAISRAATITQGSTLVSVSNTSGLVVGQLVSGTGTGLTTPIEVTIDSATSTITKINHGLPNRHTVSFPSLTGVTGVSINKVYWVVNASADTFQISDIPDGAPLTITAGGTATMRYPNFIVSVAPNTSVTLNVPATGTFTGNLVFRLLDYSQAIMKGWTVSG